MLAAAAIALFLQQHTYWSPYYKITLTPAQPSGYNLDVNSIGHQSMIPWQNKEPFYRRVYELFPGRFVRARLDPRRRDRFRHRDRARARRADRSRRSRSIR